MAKWELNKFNCNKKVSLIIQNRNRTVFGFAAVALLGVLISLSIPKNCQTKISYNADFSCSEVPANQKFSEKKEAILECLKKHSFYLKSQFGVKKVHFPEIYYPPKESSKVIVLIHGLGGSPYHMKEVAMSFVREGFIVYLPLLSGHGSADETLSKISYGVWLSDVKKAFKFADSLAEQVYMGGHSLGAGLVLSLLSKPLAKKRAPAESLDGGRVKGLFLIEPFVGVKEGLRFEAKASCLLKYSVKYVETYVQHIKEALVLPIVNRGLTEEHTTYPKEWSHFNKRISMAAVCEAQKLLAEKIDLALRELDFENLPKTTMLRVNHSFNVVSSRDIDALAKRLRDHKKLVEYRSFPLVHHGGILTAKLNPWFSGVTEAVRRFSDEALTLGKSQKFLFTGQ